MKRSRLILIIVGLLGATATTAALLQPNGAPSGPPGDAPELGRIGTLGVGTVVEKFTMTDRVRISTVGALTGSLPVEERTLNVRLWYPAIIDPKAPRMRYTRVVNVPAGKPFPVSTQGIAVQSAPVVAGQDYPLVLISHGYSGWDTAMSNLAETLASKGYVVAAIDHADMPFDSTRTFLLSFGNVMVDRAQDQRQILSMIIKHAGTDKAGYASIIDTNNIGLIGYSMGGFGALATAGAPYDPASKTISQLPKSAQSAITNGSVNSASSIKALVLFAPWGGQPDNRSWTSAGLSQIKMPVLVVGGDHDDVADFDHGISWIYDNLTGADRSMLVYREARHNIVNNPVAVTADTDFQTLEYFTEPVWRTERINAINQHFVTAFLDRALKGDASKAAYLEVPGEIAGDGDWPSKPGEQLGGKMAGAGEPKYWRGFQRRWALGLELHSAVKGSVGKLEKKAAAKP
jgi:predicted dienelactone hydrolase